MEQINNHSPLPWVKSDKTVSHVFSAKGRSVANCAGTTSNVTDEHSVNEDNSEFIVTACNSYYQSQETISSLTERVKELEDGLRELIKNHHECFTCSRMEIYDDELDKARALLTPKNNGE